MKKDLDLLRKRLCEINTTRYCGTIREKTDRCVEWCETMGDDGLWQDVNHTCYNLMDWQAADHLSRLLFMSMVWSDDTSELCGDNALLRLITRGLDAWYDLSPQNPNWWWMEIGIPQKLAGILLYVSRFCDSSYVERAIPAFVAHEPATRYTGQNLVWVAMIAVSHGVLVEDRELISHGLNLVHRELRIMARSEGLQPDTSFFQHGLLLYSGGYGQSFASLVAQALWIASGTGFEQPDQVEKIELLSRFILDGSRWMIRGSTFDYSAVGREISRAGHSAVNLFHGAAYLAKIDNKRRAELLELADSPKTKSMPLKGNRMFWCADYMTHHRAGYSITVRVPSTRLINVDFACCGGEGRVCHHMAEGATFIYCDGDEYRDIFPVWNWRQVPGTTVEQHLGSLDENKLRHFGNRDFAGGASDGNVGCIAAEISDETLAAHKAWFLFDGGMVALGTAISSSAEVPVRTTIDQCHPRGTLLYNGEPLKDSVTPLAPDRELNHNKLAVTLLQNTNGEVRLERRTGSWSDCGVGSATPETHDVLSIGIDHGVRPDGAKYAYTVQPLSSDSKVWRDEISILSNSAMLQAVWHSGEQCGQAVFYEKGEVCFPGGQRLAFDSPCVCLYRREGNAALLHIAEPTQKVTAITVTLSGLINSTVTVSLPQKEYAGSTISLKVGSQEGEASLSRTTR